MLYISTFKKLIKTEYEILTHVISSQEFRTLSKELKYEVLTELCERRKQSSWNKLHEMPKSSASFSGFQMERLINRSRVQKTKDNVGKEIGEENALQVDANLFVGDVQGLKKAKAEAKKVMSSSSGSHILYVKDLKNAISYDRQLLLNGIPIIFQFLLTFPALLEAI